MPFKFDKYTFIAKGKARFGSRTPGFLGSALEHGDRGKLNPCLPSLPVPALFPQPEGLWVHIHGPEGAVHTWEAESRKRPLQGQGPRYPECGVEAHTPGGRGLRAALFIDTLSWLHSSYCKELCCRIRAGGRGTRRARGLLCECLDSYTGVQLPSLEGRQKRSWRVKRIEREMG